MGKCLIDPIKAIMLYEQGMRDKDMAAELGVTRRQIEHWRWTRRLPANAPKHGKTPEQARMIDDMLKTTANDKEIAAAVGLSSDAVRRYRVQRGIPTASVRAGGEPPKRINHGGRKFRDYAPPPEREKGPWDALGISPLAYDSMMARKAGLSYGMYMAAKAARR